MSVCFFQSSHSHFINNTLNLSLKTIISLLNPHNQSPPPFSLIQFNNAIQLIIIQSFNSHNEWIITSVLMLWWCVLMKNEKWEMKKRNWEDWKETHTHCVIQLTPKTVLEISSKEGREWGFDWTHAETSWMYGCGQSGLREGRCSWLVILVRNSVTSENDSSE